MRRKVIAAPRNAAEAVAVGVSLVLVCGAAVTVIGDTGFVLLPSPDLASGSPALDEVPASNDALPALGESELASPLPGSTAGSAPSASNLIDAVRAQNGASATASLSPTNFMLQDPTSLPLVTLTSATGAAVPTTSAPGGGPSTTVRPPTTGPTTTSPTSNPTPEPPTPTDTPTETPTPTDTPTETPTPTDTPTDTPTTEAPAPEPTTTPQIGSEGEGSGAAGGQIGDQTAAAPADAAVPAAEVVGEPAVPQDASAS